MKCKAESAGLCHDWPARLSARRSGSVRRATPGTGFLLLACAAVLWWANRAAPPLPAGAHADLVVLKKGARRLELYRGSELLRTYHVSLGPHPDGPKQRQGDGRTPEGKYTLDYRKA